MSPPGPGRPARRLPPLAGPLAAGFAATLLAALLALLAGRAAGGDVHAIDEAVLRAALALRAAHPRVTEAMRDLSGLGSTTVLTLATTLTVLWLALVGRRLTALLVALSALSGSAAVSLLKAAFGRLRPDGALAALVVEGLSFPSGHATMSAVVWLTLGALVARTRPAGPQRAYVLGGAALVTGLVGASRVVLGVHWLTDVLAGWAIGAAWALAWLLLARRLASRSVGPGTGREPDAAA